MMFSAMHMDAFQDSDTGFQIRYRFDGNILNLRKLQAKIKVQTGVLDELYADDMDKNTSSEATMHKKGHVQKVAVHQPALGKPYHEPTITVNGQKLKVVDKFTY